MKDQEIDSGGGWNWSAIPAQEEKKPQRARRADRHKYPKPMPEPVVYYGRGACLRQCFALLRWKVVFAI